MQESALHVLLWQAFGSSDVTVDEDAHVLEPGHALWIPAGSSHDFTVRDNSVTVPLFFDAASAARTPQRPMHIAVAEELNALMLAYSVSWHTMVQPPANLGRQLLAVIAKSSTAPSAPPLPTTSSVRTIADALRSNPGDGRSVHELAASVHLSVRTVERHFRAETGMTLRRWRILTRMNAASLLLRTPVRVDEVAHLVGYTNISAFSRVFAAHYGISPAEYMRNPR